MTDGAEDTLTSTFEGHRPHLRAVAYRMLGSSAEADDAVQEAWLRYRRTDTSDVANLGGWLTTVVSRVCLNLLRSRTTRREEPLDPHVPDPVVTPVAALDPEQEVVLADSVGLALLVVLEALSPAERVAFVLHDMFSVPFEDIAPVVDRTPEATRQLASRARRRVDGSAPVPEADPARRREVVDAPSPPPGAVTWGRSSRCSTPTSCCGRTGARWPGRRCYGAPTPCPGRPPCSAPPTGSSGPCWSTVSPASSSRSRAGRSRSWPSPWPAGGSSPSTPWATPTGSGAWPCRDRNASTSARLRSVTTRVGRACAARAASTWGRPSRR